MYSELAAGIVPTWDKRNTSDEQWEAPPLGWIRRSILRRRHLSCGRGKMRAARQGREDGRSGEIDAAPAGAWRQAWRTGRTASWCTGWYGKQAGRGGRGWPEGSADLSSTGWAGAMTIMRTRTDPVEFDIWEFPSGGSSGGYLEANQKP